MRTQFKEEAAVLIERMAQLAADTDSVCTVQNNGVLMSALWVLVITVAYDIRRTRMEVFKDISADRVGT